MSENTTELTGGAYGDFISAGVTLIDFWADWCGPCKAVAPIIDDVAAEYAGKIRVGKVNVDEEGNADTVKALGILNIPTLILYKDGAIVERVMGMRPKSALIQLINKHLN